jgi:hypothetical protein
MVTEALQVFHRLSQESMGELRRQLPPITTPEDGVQAAYQLGIQLVLQKLQQGFVIGEA